MPALSALKYDKLLAFATRTAYLLDMPAGRPDRQRVPVAVIGLGAVGRALAASLVRAGFGPLTLIGRGRPGERTLARALKARYLVNLHEATQGHGYVLLCVKDSQIASIKRELLHINLEWNKFVVLHTSGVHGSDVLKPLARKGAAVAAWHPYQTFPKVLARRSGAVTSPQPDLFSGVTFGISGEPKAVHAASRLARAIGGKPLVLRNEDRVFYHLSAVLACGFVAANLDMAVRVLAHIGLSRKRALEMVHLMAANTLENVATFGAARALTGPAVRGDIATIRKHLRALKEFDPDLARIYAAVSRQLLKRS